MPSAEAFATDRWVPLTVLTADRWRQERTARNPGVPETSVESLHHPRKTESRNELLMPETVTRHLELTCLQGLADLERIQGPWLNALASSDTEVAVVIMRLLFHPERRSSF